MKSKMVTQTSIRYIKLLKDGRSIKIAIVSELKENGAIFYYKINNDKTDFEVFNDITENEKQQSTK